MDPVYKPPSILRLTGITLEDYEPVEDAADARFLDNGSDGLTADPDAPAPESARPHDKIPRVFTGLEDWPHCTNLRCWVCTFTFDDCPKFVPTHVREGEDGGLEFGVHGNMCTFNCAELWIETHLKGEERWRAQDNLLILYFLFTGRRVTRIQPAPCKTNLRQYGGDWDEDTFWRRLRALDPLAGLRDHTPGSVIPERERAEAARAAAQAAPFGLCLGGALPRPLRRALAAGPGGAAEAKPKGGALLLAGPASAWGVCGLRPASALEEDSVPLLPSPPGPPEPGPVPPLAAPPEPLGFASAPPPASAPGQPEASGAEPAPEALKPKGPASRPDNLAAPRAGDLADAVAADLREGAAPGAGRGPAGGPAPPAEKEAESQESRGGATVSDFDLDELLAELGAL